MRNDEYRLSEFESAIHISRARLFPFFPKKISLALFNDYLLIHPYVLSYKEFGYAKIDYTQIVSAELYVWRMAGGTLDPFSSQNIKRADLIVKTAEQSYTCITSNPTQIYSILMQKMPSSAEFLVSYKDFCVDAVKTKNGFIVAEPANNVNLAKAIYHNSFFAVFTDKMLLRNEKDGGYTPVLYSDIVRVHIDMEGDIRLSDEIFKRYTGAATVKVSTNNGLFQFFVDDAYEFYKSFKPLINNQRCLFYFTKIVSGTLITDDIIERRGYVF